MESATTPAPDDGPNADQARYWTTEGGPSWVRHERRYETQLQPFDDALVTRLDPRPGERILDIGCGFGPTSLAVASHGATVHGVDISEPMVERARERAVAAGASATFAVADAQEFPLGGPFDAVVSRFGVMFFSDPTRAFANIASSTALGARLAFMCWQSIDRNPWLALPIEVVRTFDTAVVSPTAGAATAPPNGVPNPMAFADPDFVHEMLTVAGWTDIALEPIEPMLSVGGEGGIDGAVEIALNGSSAKALLANADDALRDQVRDRLVERFEPFVVDGEVRMQSAAWLVTARRTV